MGKRQSKFSPSKAASSVKIVSLYPREDSPFTETPTAESENTMSGVEYVVCDAEELKDGEMKEVEVGSRKALLVREGGNYYAVGPKCSHFGAPLASGVLCNGRVRCPWHGACFNIKTGDIEDFPGLDSIPKFDVSVKNGKVFVKDDPTTSGNKRVKPMSKASRDNKQTFVLIGSGAASVTCAQTLRQEGFTGRVVMVTQEKYLPYDRTKLTKVMTTKPEDIALKDAEFYKSADIEIMNEKEVVGVDTKTKSVTFKDGGNIKYDSLLIATGGKPRILPIPGIELDNVCQVRNPAEANKIGNDTAGKNVVILGSSFIGLEVAAFMASRKTNSITVIGRSSMPLQVILGKQVGAVYKKLHEEKGVKFYFENSIKEFVGENGKVKEVLLADGTKLPADICVLGIGVVPSTDFLKNSGINLTSRGFVTVDKGLKTNVAGVFAAGDIVEFPLFMNENTASNVQHWQMANQHGETWFVIGQ
ncbi:apoptosis-inducing factor 3-like [Gigantopelta aegis]|uniref:apoptosis-inducing factor 3-like n=1 Tax=Gigantopelta aegis TaxID=1735272 RepID=UPI001B88D15A|nr:apoptosis-inducing factor 3-like [Gigantopelta aegis]